MKVQIDNAIPRIDYSIQGKPVEWIDVKYTIDGDYHDTLALKRAEYDPKTIHQIVATHAASIVGAFGKVVEI